MKSSELLKLCVIYHLCHSTRVQVVIAPLSVRTLATNQLTGPIPNLSALTRLDELCGSDLIIEDVTPGYLGLGGLT